MNSALPQTKNTISAHQKHRLVHSTNKIGYLLGSTPILVDGEEREVKRARRQGSIFSVPTQPTVKKMTDKKHTPPPLILVLHPVATDNRLPISPSIKSPLFSPPIASPASPSWRAPHAWGPRTPTAQQRRRRMAKLARTLGERVPMELVFPSSTSPRSPHRQTPRKPTPPSPKPTQKTSIPKPSGPRAPRTRPRTPVLFPHHARAPFSTCTEVSSWTYTEAQTATLAKTAPPETTSPSHTPQTPRTSTTHLEPPSRNTKTSKPYERTLPAFPSAFPSLVPVMRAWADESLVLAPAVRAWAADECGVRVVGGVRVGMDRGACDGFECARTPCRQEADEERNEPEHEDSQSHSAQLSRSQTPVLPPYVQGEAQEQPTDTLQVPRRVVREPSWTGEWSRDMSEVRRKLRALKRR